MSDSEQHTWSEIAKNGAKEWARKALAIVATGVLVAVAVAAFAVFVPALCVVLGVALALLVLVCFAIALIWACVQIAHVLSN